MKLNTAVPVFLAILLGGALIPQGVGAGEEEETVISDKPLSQWLSQLRGANRGHQLRAAQALSDAPAEKWPKIVPHLIPILKSERENDRFVAAQSLGNYGPAARAAVPELVPLLKGTQFERNRAASAKALGLILKDAQPSEEVEGVATALVGAFGDHYEDVRRESVFALGMIGPAAKSCIPALAGKLSDVQPVRNAAAWTCGRMGKLAACHVDRIIANMHGERFPQVDPFFTKANPEALGLIGPVQENIVPNMMDQMESIAAGSAYHPQHNGEMARLIYIAGAQLFERFGPAAKAAVPYLNRVIKNNPFGDREKSLAIVKALGAIGPAAAEALPALQTIADAKAPPKPEPNFTALKEAAAKAVAAIKGAPAAAPAEPAKKE